MVRGRVVTFGSEKTGQVQARRYASSTQSLLNSTALVRLCRAGALGLALSGALLATPALADGGAGGNAAAGGITGGTGGTGFTGNPGEPGTTNPGSAGVGAGGGGGGAGGGKGGNGGDGVYGNNPASNIGGGLGGDGGTAASPDGQNGAHGDIAGGGGGGGGGFNGNGAGAATITNSSALAGGKGGNGGLGDVGGGGGGGGAGGYGAIVTGAGANSNTSTITGGNGGNGGGAAGGGGHGGNGGDGGIGVQFTAAGATFANSGTVTGGNGGTAGTPGFGGAGIVGSDLTVINSGSISGGLSGNGVTRANAITFTGGSNTLTLQNGSSLTGNIAINGAGSITFNQSTAQTLANVIVGNGSIIQNGTGTLTLSGANSYLGGTVIAGGTLRAGNNSALGTGPVDMTASGTTLDLNGHTVGVGGLSGVAGSTVQFGSGSALALDVATGTSHSFAGNLVGNGSSFNFVLKSGAGTQSLSGNNTLAGVFAVQQGTLSLDSATAMSSAAFLEVASGAQAKVNGVGLTIGELVTTGSGDGTVELAGGSLTVARAGAVNAFAGHLTGTGDFIVNGSGGLVQTLSGTSDYSGATKVEQGTLKAGANGSFSANSAHTISSGATLDLNGFNETIGSLAGAGLVTLGTGTLTAGGDNSSTTFSGGIDGSGGFTKTGTGTMTLAGVNSYSGATIVNGGTLRVSSDLTSSSGIIVNALGTLTGTGPASAVQVNAGGAFAPGTGTPGSSMTVASLAFQSGAFYAVNLNPTTSSFANVTGAATLGGATVVANFAPVGGYVQKQYTILNAGSISGTFNSTVVNTNLPSGFKTSLSYDAAHTEVYLDLALDILPPSTNGVNVNQRNVVNAVTNFFNATGSIPLAFGNLTPNGLTQASGELGTGSQQTSFQAMTMFMDLLTDPFSAGRGGDANGGGATGFADESASMAYAGRAKSKTARDAFAAYTKAPPRAAFDQRWSVWASGFGGSQTTDGNAVVGSNNTTSSINGAAVGADYWFSPDTLAGFAMAGAGSNFSVANGGTGRSDIFQAGAFVRHNFGATYLTAAAAYGWQDVTTDRYVSVAGVDHLRANFNANAYSGRIELGHRFLTPWFGGLGVSPYAAAQTTAFELPSYNERAISGASTFALNYGADTVTASRTELGLRSDKSFALDGAVLTLRGRAAWAHDFNPDRAITATFQTLPGASFITNGAALASDSALATASAEVRWLNGWSVAATFEGEFSDVTRSYAGKGVLRYNW
ncbi:hypothetical protein AC629_18070 [Bradyrhizobium sp. NAS80.1]|nr:hypothetical protein AC629_18070 [Bradyrhizobium sp. NAS80.1]